MFRRAFHGAFIAAGGHSRASGIAAINANHCDAVAYGRPYLANPDLVKRFEIDAPLNKYDRWVVYLTIITCLDRQEPREAPLLARRKLPSCSNHLCMGVFALYVYCIALNVYCLV